MQIHTSFYLALCFLATTLGIPGTNLITDQQNSTTVPPIPSTNLTLSSASGPRLKCAHRPILPFTSDTRPTFEDCTIAIGLLPDTHDSGVFHSRRRPAWFPPDPFQLPLRRIWFSCIVEVEIKDPNAEMRSSWFEIRAAAQHLNVECRVGKKHGTDVTGGKSDVRERNGIRVRLVSSGGP